MRLDKTRQFVYDNDLKNYLVSAKTGEAVSIYFKVANKTCVFFSNLLDYCKYNGYNYKIFGDSPDENSKRESTDGSESRTSVLATWCAQTGGSSTNKFICLCGTMILRKSGFFDFCNYL